MPTPRTPQRPAAARAADSYETLARRLVAAGGPGLAGAVAQALRDAHRAGFAAGAAAPVPEAEAALLEDLGAALAVGDPIAFRQPLGSCPGMPWHMSIGGRLVLSGDFAALVPDAAVRGLVARGALAWDGDGAAGPGPLLAELVRPPAPSRGPGR